MNKTQNVVQHGCLDVSVSKHTRKAQDVRVIRKFGVGEIGDLHIKSVNSSRALLVEENVQK